MLEVVYQSWGILNMGNLALPDLFNPFDARSMVGSKTFAFCIYISVMSVTKSYHMLCKLGILSIEYAGGAFLIYHRAPSVHVKIRHLFSGTV